MKKPYCTITKECKLKEPDGECVATKKCKHKRMKYPKKKRSGEIKTLRPFKSKED